ncbi:MAG: DUF359 domain-containing protein [Candidatus Paceibacterota bacterium]|nr:DUF359 domain-containing protein [Candidatus Paceibacterota bacterium]
MPDSLREKLREPIGFPIFGSDDEVSIRFNRLAWQRNFKKVITVGDYCSLNLPSNVKIFDGKTQRMSVPKGLGYDLFLENPAGTIQSESWRIIKEAIFFNKNVFVEGEEDLLAIPCVLLSEKGFAVVYGQPGKGVCVIESSPLIKKYFNDLLSNFKII